MSATTQGINWTHAEATALGVRVCPSCGITYALPGARRRGSQSEGRELVFAPMGTRCRSTRPTQTGLRKSARQLEKKLADEKANAEWWRKREADRRQEAEHERSRANGYKGALTKVKKRVGNGVCPCCNRSFADLGQHMEAQHPTFKEPVA